MSRAKSWSVKGVDEETRAFARTAAKDAGMTIGGWIEQAIRRVALRELDAVEVDRSSAASARQEIETSFGATNEDGAESERDSVAEEEESMPPDQDHGTGKSVTPAIAPAPRSRRKVRRQAVQAALVVVLAATAGGGLWLVNETDFLTTARPGSADKTTKTVAEATSAAPPSKARTSPAQQERTAAAVPPASASRRPAHPAPEGRQQATRQTASPASTAPTSAPAPATAKAPTASENPIQALMARARAGDPVAQHELAQAYTNGRGIVRDDRAAAKWLQRAAESEYVAAQLELGRRYEQGQGLDKDPAMAAFWYRKAADWGDTSAQYRIGRAYATGTGVPRDPEEAARWLERAAAAGVLDAQITMAELYERGAGVPRDHARAISLYEAAAAAGSSAARQRLEALRDGEAAAASAAKARTEQDAKSAQTNSGVPPGATAKRGIPAKRETAATQAVGPERPAAPPKPAGAVAASRAPKPEQKPASTPTRTVAVAPPTAGNPTAGQAAKSSEALKQDQPVRTAARSGLSKSAILEMQKLLARLSFLPGRPDGVLGDGTVAAIRRYQAFAGLEVDGKATAVLLEELRLVAGDVTKPGG